MKRTIIILAITVTLVLSASACGSNTVPNEQLSHFAADAILSDNSDAYHEGECIAEGHKILGSNLSGNRLKIYALTMYGNYGFQNDMFVKISGSGVIPAVLSFEKNGEGYKLLDIEYPLDGAGYTDSIKRMFPLKYRFMALHADNYGNELKIQERDYAEEYLKSIGREAKIGDFIDVDVILLTDAGVSADVSNRLSYNKELSDYPFWVGTEEYLENGMRYVRSTTYDEKTGQIIYCTYRKDTGAVTECFVFDAVTGDPLPTETVVSQMGADGLPDT